MSLPHFTSLPSPLLTRSDVSIACKSLLTPLLPFFSPGNTRVKLGATATRYDESGAQLEGYIRPLWGLASLLAGNDNTTRNDDGADGGFKGVAYWLTGLRNGTNPSHPEFWGYARDLDQRMVEMCPLGYALCVAPQDLWDPLTNTEKHNVQKWLGWINGKEMPNTNWLWFRVFANLGMMKNGMEFDEGKLGDDLNHLDTFYRGGGWSNDGPDGYIQMDYYSGSFAIQFLQLLYVKINGGRDSKRAEEYRERARLFAKDFVHYFDEQGRAITFGRSLTYRFAMAGFWSAVAFAELELPPPLTWGVVKGLLLRNLRWWTTQKDALSLQGTLTIGYSYPNQFLSENYNSPGSPYWYMLGFVALALPDSHPFWQCAEEPYPSSSIPQVVALQHPKHIMVCKGGHTFLLSSGQRCHYPMRVAESKYGKFAYSSAFGYSVSTGGYFIQAVGGDNVLALSEDEGETWKVRRVTLDARIEEQDGKPVLVSGWKPWSDVAVETYLLPPEDETPNWHLRVHRISTARRVQTSEGAFAINGERESDGRELEALAGDSSEGRRGGDGESVALSRSGAVGMVELHTEIKRTGQVLEEDANSNLLHSRSVLPSLSSTLEGGDEIWFATAVFAVPASLEASLEGWQDSWKSGWHTRPQVPQWLRQKMS